MKLLLEVCACAWSESQNVSHPKKIKITLNFNDVRQTSLKLGLNESNQIEDYLRLMICPEMCRSVIFIDPPPFRIHAHGPLMVSMQCASA